MNAGLPADLQGADFEAGAAIGRGSGNGTLKELKAAFVNYFKRKAAPSGQWRTQAQRQLAEQRADVERTRVALRSALSPTATPAGLPLRRWSRDTWRQL